VRCADCGGTRLHPEARLWRVGGLTLPELFKLPIREAGAFIHGLELPPSRDEAATLILDEVKVRLGFLLDLGLDYLTLDRASRTPSGGEVERVNLTAAIGSALVNTLYVLDEPSIGLHERDNARLVATLRNLRDKGNTVIVVEHDPDILGAADRIVDMGPGPGEAGGEVIYNGSYEGLLDHQTSLTGRFLSGMTSHAALVARGWGKCCVVGAQALDIDYAAGTIKVKDKTLRQGDWLSLNGSRGFVYEGSLPLQAAEPEKNQTYLTLMAWADKVRKLGVRANADRPEDAALARRFGAEGIGLTRTEHMFFEPERIKAVRELIVAETLEARRAAVMKLVPFQKKDFTGILEAMKGLPVVIRLLDPPLHEFVPHEDHLIAELATELKIDAKKLKARIGQLHELNPMLGHRGCRLGITYPEITEMQARAVFEAAADLTKRGVKVHPEVMVPLIGTAAEFENQHAIVARVAAEVQKATKVKLKFHIGTMMEIPRGCLAAGEVAKTAEFFSFGTNDLTQTTFGFSRDDIGGFLPDYLTRGILKDDPFQTIDQEGVGELVRIAVERGRKTNPKLVIGICGEHGGDPASVEFFHRTGLDYVSCSPFRVPIARLAAAHAALKDAQGRRKARP